MKRFLVRILIFLLLCIIVDRLVGFGFQHMFIHSKGGYVKHHINIIDKSEAPLLIFGSSRAVHHYNTAILSDSLNIETYNCGQDGNGIILAYGEWLQIKKRYTPKILLYDISLSFDTHIGHDNHRYLGWLKPFYNRDGIPDIFSSVDSTENIKMSSMMYRYNYNALQIITDYFHPIHHFNQNGYLPLKVDSINKKKIKEPGSHQYKIDTLKIFYLEKLIQSASPNTQIVFIYSPSWYGVDNNLLAPILELCNKYNILFLNYGNNKKYYHNNSYFADGMHMNSKGADEFTKDLIPQLRILLNHPDNLFKDSPNK